MTVTLPVRVELERKGSASTPGAILTRDEGVVEALVSITGVVDNVGDLIVPGSYRRTLGERRPKGIFSHDTKVWTARTEAIEELLPGDPRLPKTTKDGRPWPREAGALYVKCRFNLASDDGRNAYETVRFFSETDECEWSIGYTVPKGGAKSRSGVRYITDLDLWEYSPVLFGAASMSATLSVKANQPAGATESNEGGEVGDEWDDLLTPDTGSDDAAASVVGVDQGAMIALAVPADAAAELAIPDGLAPDDLHVTLVYMGKNIPSETWEQAIEVARQVAAKQGPLAGQLGGIGAFPAAEDGVPVFVPVDVPGLEVLRQRLAEALDAAGIEYAANHGYTPHVTLRYVEPGEPMPDPVAPVPVAFDGLTVVADDEPTAIPFGAGAGAAEVKSAQLPLSGVQVPLSFEETRDAIRSAVAGWLDGQAVKGWVSVDATFADQAVVTVIRDDDIALSYQVPYTVTGDGVDVGEPAVVSVDRAGEVDELAAVDAVEDAVHGLKQTGGWETKAGRVLSDANAKRLRTALSILREVLAAAGIPVDHDKTEIPVQDEENPPPPPSIMPDSTAPSAMPNELKEHVVLTGEEIRAGLDIIAEVKAWS
ncbi:2'-5' RNA ligase family protein [Nonomuraea sp. NPDC005650]|uniref:2'-5' RNA ligase family protein n=1 Tax=Nonomuraea sp. NPDC005650 TaxID=3157045 RepID=UPI0033A63F4D